MFSKVSILFVASVAALAVASPVPEDRNQCNTGSIQCCNSIYESQSASGSYLLSLVGLAAQGITGQFGLQCSPITGVGIGGGPKCVQSPMCCTDNHFNGLIAVGCTPVSVSL